ncbi:hypothetical protein E4T56_gene4577 [Termitomyces sp. T112]|nr:hypothetical protein E4T56_gene4577 [Termitomyces sp. T112]
MFPRVIATFVLASTLLVSAASTLMPLSQCPGDQRRCCAQIGTSDSPVIEQLLEVTGAGSVLDAVEYSLGVTCQRRPYNGCKAFTKTCCSSDDIGTDGYLQRNCVPTTYN